MMFWGLQFAIARPVTLHILEKNNNKKTTTAKHGTSATSRVYFRCGLQWLYQANFTSIFEHDDLLSKKMSTREHAERCGNGLALANHKAQNATYIGTSVVISVAGRYRCRLHHRKLCTWHAPASLLFVAHMYSMLNLQCSIRHLPTSAQCFCWIFCCEDQLFVPFPPDLHIAWGSKSTGANSVLTEFRMSF